MWNWIRTLDRILRGEVTRLPNLRAGQLDIPIFGLIVIIDMLAVIYGACMGIFALTTGGSGAHMQIVASMVKVPALFLLTLLVTFPSLYVFNALVGSRLQLVSVLRLLIASLAVMLAVLSSIGPIVAFFSFTTTSYPFMLLLNVLVCAVAGLLGLAFLLQTLHRLTIAGQLPVPPVPPMSAPPVAEPQTWAAKDELPPTTGVPLSETSEGSQAASPQITPPPTGDTADAGPLDQAGDHVLGSHVRTVFRIWIIVFGLVGAQMAWVLRPFIGTPGQAFTWFRAVFQLFPGGC